MLTTVFCAAPSCPEAAPKSMMRLEVVDCPEAVACIMNVVGEEGILAEQVGVWVGNYQAPSVAYSSCRLERHKARRAAAYLEETLRNAEYVFLVEAHKKPGSPYLVGKLMVDGVDVTTLMFQMKLAVPRGIKVDWCEKVSRGIEV